MTSPQTPPARPALGIGPANYAGQAQLWARAAARELGVTAWAFSRTGPRPAGFQTDRTMPPRGGPLSVRHHIDHVDVAPAIAGSTHVAIDGFLPLSGAIVFGSVAKDVRELQRSGRMVALISHGSDTRDPRSHARRLTHSWFRTAGVPFVEAHVIVSGRNRRLARTLGVPVFVSTPDLLHDLPEATWLPLVVDLPAATIETMPPLTRAKPVVLHLPSRKVPPIKGTDAISAAMRRLDAEGLVDYVEPDLMTHERLLELIWQVDIVIDQVRSDAYGVTAVEAMAAGRVTVSSVLGTRRLLPENPPIVDATPETLERVVRSVVTERDRYATLAARGPGYVRCWHDGRAASAALAPFLGLPPPAGAARPTA